MAQPDFEQILAVMAAASQGDSSARVPFGDDLDPSRPEARLAVALNLLLDDLEYRGGRLDAQGRALQEAEEGLRQSQRLEALGRLAGGVAHDFNNLLSVIQGYNDLSLNALRSGDPMRADLVQVQTAAKRAAALTQQLLAFGRRQVLNLKPVDLNAVVLGMEPMLSRLLGVDAHLDLRLGPGLGTVRADVGQMEQVLMNLAINARDALPKGGRLSIATSDLQLSVAEAAVSQGLRPGPHVLLEVVDNGSGMSRELQARIFEPFFTTKPKGKGTGLGLSTVFGIVKQTGGSLWVESAPGQGSRFSLCFPRVAEAAQGPSKEEAKPLRPGRGLVLVAEDEAGVRGMTCQVLRRAGYDVLEAGGGEEALAMGGAEPGPIGALVTDVLMPRLGGRELAERLVAARPGLKVLFVSGNAEGSLEVGGSLPPGQAFLQKPFSPEALLLTLQGLLE